METWLSMKVVLSKLQCFLNLFSYDEAIKAHHSFDCQRAILALDNGADRDNRVFEGVW